MSDLFDSPSLRIEQPRKVLATRAQYKIFNAEKILVAVVTEADSKTRAQVLKTTLPASASPGAQTLVVSTADEIPFLVLEKHQGGRLTEVRRPDGDMFGSIRAERTTRHYTLLDAEGHRVGEVAGDLALRKFFVTDPEGDKVAKVTKKWAGLATEILTTADRYSVEMLSPQPDPLRTLIAMTAIVLDLLLHESKTLT